MPRADYIRVNENVTSFCRSGDGQPVQIRWVEVMSDNYVIYRHSAPVGMWNDDDVKRDVLRAIRFFLVD